MKLIAIPDKHYDTIIDTLQMDAISRAFDSKLRQEISDALDSMKEYKPQVKIEVTGGVAEVTRCTPGVIVTIQDHDNEESGH